MIDLITNNNIDSTCPTCSNPLNKNKGIIWQGVHVCSDEYCEICKEGFLCNFPIGQAKLLQYKLRKSDNAIFGKTDHIWLTDPLKNIVNNPIKDLIKFEVKALESNYKKVIILNTLDNCYGHSLLAILNLHELIQKKGDYGIIVIVQPSFEWLIPSQGVSEIWKVSLSFNQLKDYYEDLTTNINREIERFDSVSLASTNLCPKNTNINHLTDVSPYNFDSPPTIPRVSFIWREDVNRFWLKSYWIYGILRKLKIASIILPFQYLRVLLFLYILKSKLNKNNINRKITIVGLGSFGRFPKFVDDKRVDNFNKEIETEICKIYAESELVVGVHGSSMILPSAHSGMTVSIMPLKRWGNYIEDILFSEVDVRLAAFQKRVVPMNTTIMEICEICEHMVKDREVFINKFIASEIIKIKIK